MSRKNNYKIEIINNKEDFLHDLIINGMEDNVKYFYVDFEVFDIDSIENLDACELLTQINDNTVKWFKQSCDNIN